MTASGKLGPVLLGTGLLMAATALPLGAQTASANGDTRQPAIQLVRDVVYNEAQDRERDSHWEYRSDFATPEKRVVREQVETSKGPVFRMMELNGVPLNDAQQAQEERRIEGYIHDPAQVARIARAHEDDENRVAATLRLLPQALLFDYLPSSNEEVAVLAFRPNPAFNPPTYEARLIHTLTGTVTVNVRQKRMVDMRGTVAERVDFGYGILGHVEKGGNFEIHRRPVNAAHWKTDLVDVHLQGKVLLLKTVSKDEREARSDFRPVPGGTTLAEAKDMLDRATGDTQARLMPADGQRATAEGRGNR
jgi:hypothetical protein